MMKWECFFKPFTVLKKLIERGEKFFYLIFSFISALTLLRSTAIAANGSALTLRRFRRTNFQLTTKYN